MHRGSMRICTVAAALILSAGIAPAQSLVEMARQERARRAAIAPEDRSRVYTNDDLRASGGLTIGALPAAVPPTAETGAGRAESRFGSGETVTEDVAAAPLDEDGWRTRMTGARADHERALLLASALQNRVDGLWVQFTAMDDPARRRTIEHQRSEALAELERTQAETVRLEERIGEIREEARRAGVPPGWLR